MCLISKTRKGLISDCDIHCYKLLIPIGEELHTPYRDFIFTLNQLVIDKEKEEIVKVPYGYTISKGFIHSFSTFEAALEEIALLYIFNDIGDKVSVYEAIIPKGTLYYKGMDGDMCSKSLKIIRKNSDKPSC